MDDLSATRVADKHLRKEVVLRLAVSATLLTIVVIVSLIPLIYVSWFGLWWPAALNDESYTVFVTAFEVMKHGYTFVRNAHFFSLLFAYPATIINDIFFWIFPTFSEFDRFSAFGTTMQALNVVAVAIVCGRSMLSKYLLFGEKLMVVWIVIGYQTLTILIHNFTEINYHMLEALLYVACADMVIRWLWTDEAPRRSAVWIAGGLAALAVGTKLTFAVTIAPFFLLVCLPVSGRWRQWAKSAGEFCFSAVLCGFILLLGYLEFHIQYAPRLLADLTRLSTDGGWLSQHTDDLASGLRHGLDTGSIMRGFSVLIITLFSTAIVALAIWPRLSSKCRLYISVSIGVFSFFVAFAYLRLASNTVTDFVLWMLFDLAILASMIMRRSSFRWIAIVETAVLLWISISNAQYIVLGLPSATAYFKSQGDAGRAVDTLIEQRPDLPIIYYEPENAGIYRLVYPSIDLIPVLSGERREIESLYLRYVRPRVSFAAAANGLRDVAHVAVIPEKMNGLDMSNISAEFRMFLTSPLCSSVNWGDPVRGKSRVTVCEVKAAYTR